MEKTSWTYDPSTTYIMYISNDLCYFVICHLTRCSLADPDPSGSKPKRFSLRYVKEVFSNFYSIPTRFMKMNETFCTHSITIYNQKLQMFFKV